MWEGLCIELRSRIPLASLEMTWHLAALDTIALPTPYPLTLTRLTQHHRPFLEMSQHPSNPEPSTFETTSLELSTCCHVGSLRSEENHRTWTNNKQNWLMYLWYDHGSLMIQWIHFLHVWKFNLKNGRAWARNEETSWTYVGGLYCRLQITHHEKSQVVPMHVQSSREVRSKRYVTTYYLL